MPATMQPVRELLELCHEAAIDQTTLLVVPGLDWQPSQLAQLNEWEDAGHVIAAHGWRHQCQTVSSWYHHVHSWCLSRNVAEHLSLDPAEVYALMRRSADWFADQRGTIPSLYVPPAWALGRLLPKDMRQLPFQQIETLTGVIDTGSLNRRKLPLMGFEADNLLRTVSLRVFNAVNQTWSRWRGDILRIAIHPWDHQLRLRAQLRHVLASRIAPQRYDVLLS